MTPEIALTLAILAASIALFVSERLPVDVVALLILLSLALSGLLTPGEALAGFANPAVIALGSLFVISGGLFQTGVADHIARLIVRLAGQSERRLIVMLMTGVALLSSVMNNVAVTAVMLPATIRIARDAEIPPSRLLIPLAYGSILGGKLTLIGTPPFLLASDLLRERGMKPFGFFEVTPVGVLILLAGIAYMASVGLRLLPIRHPHDRLRRARLPLELLQLYRLSERVFALDVPSDSTLVGRTLAESGLGHDFGLTVMGIMNGLGRRMAPAPSEELRAGDRLLVEGGPRRLRRAAETWGLKLSDATVDESELLAEDTGVVEVTLTPRSSLEGKTLCELNLREKYGVTVLAFWRGGEPVERYISEEPLRMGDGLLVMGPWRKLQLLSSEPGLLLLSDYENVPRRMSKAPWAVAILLAVVAVVAAGILPISIAALAGALLVVATGCLRIEEAYQAIEWPSLFLVIGTLPLGTAMQKTGAAQWIAERTLSLVAGGGPLASLAVLLCLTALLNLFLSNYAVTVLVGPIAFSAATSQHLDPRTFLLAVALGASVAFATPIAHPADLLVMGPGGYRFSDYVRAGVPLSLVVFATSIAAIAFLWPI
jgi:di/tricarboxylate transporter